MGENGLMEIRIYPRLYHLRICKEEIRGWAQFYRRCLVEWPKVYGETQGKNAILAIDFLQ